MKKRALPILLVMALLIAALTVTALAAETPVAPNEVSQYANENMKGNFEETEKGISRYCPVCNTTKTWYPLKNSMTKATNIAVDASHYYLVGNVNHTGEGCYKIGTNRESVCFYLNGRNLTSEQIVFDVVGNLNLIGNGEETVSGYGYGDFNPHGDTIYMTSGSLSLYGGTYTKSSEDRGPVIGSKTAYTLNVYEGTTITGGTNGGNVGGNILLNAAGSKLNVYGGLITGGTATNGGNIAATVAGCEINISGGTISDGSASVKGGNIYSAAPVVITGGKILNGDAKNGGGNILMTGATLNIGEVGGETVVIADGKGNAGQGGNIACGGDTVIKNATISGGTTTTAWGGNLYIDSNKLTIGEDTTIENGVASAGANLTAYIATVDIDDATFIGGTTNNTGTYKGGASLYLWDCDVTIDNSSITGGNSGDAVGGNVVLKSNKSLAVTDTTFADGNGASGGNLYLNSNPNATFTGCTISGGNATSYGGNMFLDGTTGLTFTECEIQNGTCGVGGNLYVKSPVLFDDCVLTVASTVSGSGSQFFNEGAVTLKNSTMTNGTVMGDGNIVLNNTNVNMSNLDARNNSIVTLSGNTQVNKMTVSKATSGIHVMSDFTGAVNFANMVGVPEAPVYGKKLGANFTAEGSFTGKVVLSFIGDKPWAFHDEGNLVVGNARTVKGKEITWHKNNAMAALNYGDADMMYPGNHELPLAGGDYVVNVCGLDLNVTGTGTVTFFDTANKNFKDYGSVTVAETVEVANEFETAVDGLTYYMVEKDGKLSFHRLGMKISGVSIRPGNAGIYYSGTWQCDELLASKIDTFGVAVSLAGQPGADFATASQTMHTEFDKAAFVSGKNMTSVLIGNILKTDEETNQARAEMPIFATAYITFNDGENTYTVLDGGEVSFSLKQVMERIDNNPGFYRANEEAVDNFYATWQEVMKDWNFKNIGVTLSDGKSLKLLAITSSFGLNTTEALYDIAKAEGATDVTVGRLYASGCTLEMHANNIATNASPYQYTKISDATGGKWSIRYNTNMLTALQDEQWDIIFIQQGAAQSGQPSTYGNYLDQILAYVDENKTNEKAKYIWNMTWAYQQDTTQSVFHNVFHSSQFYMYEQLLSTVQEKIEPRSEFSAIIPTGTAIQNARNSFIGDTLTKDTFHLNNLGRVIAGYTLWSTITDKPLTEINLDTFASGSDYHDGMDVAVTLTQEQKAVIVEAVNAARKNPYAVTKSSYPAPEDDTLNILMIGNSYCYYYVQELYDLLAQDGIKANVYNLYKSGCTLEEHYNWWMSGHNGYQFFWKTNEDGYNLVKGNTTMAESLLAENWDVISIQESLFKNLQSIDQGSYIAQARVYMDTLIPMLRNAFPNAEIYWHQQFGPEVGFQLGQNSVPDAEAQANYVAKAAYLANFAKETYGVKIVNTGDAWAAARANEELVEMLPYGGLCARIGENSFGDKRENAGDGYHDGDIGGGQYLNACVWYETLTGNSCVGKTFELKTCNNDKNSAAYAPDYELDAALVALLQEAAHSVAQK